MKYYTYTPDGVYHTTEDGEAQLEASTDIPIPEKVDGMYIHWTGEDWEQLPIPDGIIGCSPALPTEISAVQARLVLNAMGVRQAIEDFAKTNQNFLDWWEYSTIINRYNIILLEAQGYLGWSDKQLDQMFIQGVTL